MAYFALLEGNKVVNVLVADSVADLGESAQIYTAVDVTDAAVRPSVNWTLENDRWVPDTLTGAAKALWNGTGFDTVIDAEAAPAEVEAPKKEKSK